MGCVEGSRMRKENAALHRLSTSWQMPSSTAGVMRSVNASGINILHIDLSTLESSRSIPRTRRTQDWYRVPELAYVSESCGRPLKTVFMQSHVVLVSTQCALQVLEAKLPPDPRVWVCFSRATLVD